MMQAWFGEGGMTSYVGFAGDVAVFTSGKQADEQFKSMVDRLAARKGRGITAETFAPLTVGPGFYVSMDFSRFFGEIASFMPDAEEGGEAAEAMKLLSDTPSRMVFGMRLEADALNIDMTFPLALVDAIGELSAMKRESHEGHDEEGHDHHEGGSL